MTIDGVEFTLGWISTFRQISEFKKIDIKNRACYYCDDIIKDVDTHFSDIWLDEKLLENDSVYDISHKTLMGSEVLRIRFDKIDEFIMTRGGEFRYLVLFDHRLFDKTCDKIKYLIRKKVVLQIVLIIILERSEIIYIFFYLMKKYWPFLML